MLHLLPQNDLTRTARARLAWLAVLSGLLVVGCSEDPAKKGDNQSIDNKGDGDSDDEDEGDGDGDDDTTGDGDDSTTGDGDDGEFPGGDGDDGTIVDNDGGVHVPVDDAGTGSIPPPKDGGKWTLKKGSAMECPEDIPPIPLLGGACLGVYWTCGWENEAGDQYSCTCDWIHYLCLPL